MEDVLGLSKLSVHDSGVRPMTDAFDVNQAEWTYSATPAAILYTTSLLLPGKSEAKLNAIAHCTHAANWFRRCSLPCRLLQVGEIIFPILAWTAALARFEFDTAQLDPPNLAGDGLG